MGTAFRKPQRPTSTTEEEQRHLTSDILHNSINPKPKPVQIRAEHQNIFKHANNSKKMSGDDEDDNLEVYIFQGNDNEEVPDDVEKLIIHQGVQVVPANLCREFDYLRKVILSYGLVRIGTAAFGQCSSLVEITIASTVRHIGREAFCWCHHLTKVHFEVSPSSPLQLQRIDDDAFRYCHALQRIKIPPSVDSLGQFVFTNCVSLIEADLSRTRVCEISDHAFAGCGLLQTASLPSTLERICGCAFDYCTDLVTVVVPLNNSQPIKIGQRSFINCTSLANLVLPRGSTAEEHSFVGCQLLHERCGEESANILANLVGRFDNFPIHRLCYDHAATTPEQLQRCIEEQEEKSSFVDDFGMTAFHVLLSTIGPSAELLQVLLNAFPRYVIGCKDANDKRPMDFLIKDWTDANRNLLQMSAQKWMIDPINEWGAAPWKNEIKGKLYSLLFEPHDHDEDFESEHEERGRVWKKLQYSFERFEIVESTSIIELALWKTKLLRAGRRDDSAKRQALDRGECRCVSGSDVVIPSVLKFLSMPCYDDEEY